MCGRYVISSEKDIEEMNRIINEVDEKFNAEYKTGEIFPTNTAPVFISNAGSTESTLMKWGFKSYQNKGVIINARAETAPEKRMFKTALQSRRCIIPTTGFYEWRQEEGKSKKAKYLFNQPDSDMLYLAGLYNQGETPSESRYIILTTLANTAMEDYHNRMPVILQNDLIDLWLNDKDFAVDYLHKTQPLLSAQLV